RIDDKSASGRPESLPLALLSTIGTLFDRLWTDGVCSHASEVSPLQTEVQDTDHLIAVEVCAGIISRIPLYRPERVLQDGEVGNGDHIIVVAVANQHQAHLHLGGIRARQG